MAMSKETLKNAMREAASAEFAHIPVNDDLIDYTFSEKFEKKMRKLLKAQRKPYWNYYNTVSKKVAIVFAALLMLIATACSIEEIREPIVNFVKTVFHTFIEYSYEGDTVGVITRKYQIEKLPEGFEQTKYVESEGFITGTYENENGDMILFNQDATIGSGFTWDKENGNVYSKEINGLDVEIYESDKVKQAFWLLDGYSFRIVCVGDIEMETLEYLIRQVE